MKYFFLCGLIAFGLNPFSAVSQEKKPDWPVLENVTEQKALPGTALLIEKGDFADLILKGADAYVLKQIEQSKQGRKPSREKLREILGLDRDAVPTDSKIEYNDTISDPRFKSMGIEVRRVRWNAFRDVYGYGLFIEPKGEPSGSIILIPDADQEPENLAGESGGLDQDSRAIGLGLAAEGYRVLVPSLIRRDVGKYKMTNREYLHRPAFELGRTLIGYELQKILVAASVLSKDKKPVGIAGVGEGGRLALYAGAVDERFQSVLVSGYFSPRENVWMEPADRSVAGLLNHHGDAEIASLVGGDKLILEHAAYPQHVFRGDENGVLSLSSESAPQNGKPGKLLIPTEAEFLDEVSRIQGTPPFVKTGSEDFFSKESEEKFLQTLGTKEGEPNSDKLIWASKADPEFPDERQEMQIAEIDRHNQWALIDSRLQRKAYFKDLKTDDLAMFEKTVEPYREKFYRDVVGDYGDARLPLNARSRSYQKGEGVVSYEVALDVHPGIMAYGILTLPEDFSLDGSEKRPVVVCQHGLEGRPQDVISEQKYKAYSAYATRLAQEGYITFAPQNLYIFHDRFRMLQFQSYSVGKTLFSLIVPQHEQIIDWLSEQPFVDAEKIGFYGLSYGGKSAMRIPALVDRYALSICSADFNEWIWKNAATDPESLRYSYANKREYEMYEFNLGNTFNYAEMAWLICPRPFMVERGHFDGVAPDEWVAFEYARVRNLYAARLGIPEKTTIEWFPGPHKINGVGTFGFLNQWLRQ